MTGVTSLDTPLLEIDHLHAGYAGCDIVRGVSFNIAQGQLWAVLGPNGVGKSTLLRAGLGLIPATKGQVRFLGRDVARWKRRALAQNLAWVPQQVEASEAFTGLELVLMGRHPHLGSWGLTSQRDELEARHKLEVLGLGHLANVSCSHMSGGELRLVGLARAWTQSPRIMFLDEPTAFLDLRHQVQALEALRKFVSLGGAALTVLHDVNLASAYADNVLLLRDGCALAQGKTNEVLNAQNLSVLFGVDMVFSQVEGTGVFRPKSLA